MYIRLSREDGDKQESESISNQRKILQRYVKENNLNFVKEYVDDGISGKNLEGRPEVTRLLKDIEDGKLGIIADDGFVESIKAQPLAENERILTALTEYQQYVKSSWFNELGLNSNFNGMKKEAISESEQAMNEDVLKPLIDTMLECRQKACEEINSMFDLNISVNLNSSWKDNQDELDLEHDILESEAEELETETETDPENLESEVNKDGIEQID